MLQSSLQNLRTFPAFYRQGNIRSIPEGLSYLSLLPAIKAKNAEHFHTNAGSLCYSFLESQGESPQRKWIAVFVYEEGWATHDGKVWAYNIFA